MIDTEVRPIFKRILLPVSVHDDVIRIGFERNTWEIDDPSGDVVRLIGLLDGTRSLAALAADWQATDRELADALHELDSLGMVEDAASTSQRLDESATARYRTNLDYFSNFATLATSRETYQARLLEATVVVLGLGGAGLGALCLAGMGIGTIRGLDFDHVETSNLTRQLLYSESDVARPKTAAAADRLRGANSNLRVTMVDLLVTSAADVADVIHGADLVLDGIDQPAIESGRWVNFACVRAGIPVLQGGLTASNLVLQLIAPGSGGCYDCFLIDMLRKDPAFETQLRSAYGSNFSHGNTAFAPNVAWLAGLMTSQAAKIIAGHAAALDPGTIAEVSTQDLGAVSSHRVPRLVDCPTCGAATTGAEPVALEALIAVACRHD